MNENARKFLAQLDCLYFRGWGDQYDWEDYCLECCVPNARGRPIPHAGPRFSETRMITELLEANGMHIHDVLVLWAQIENKTLESVMDKWNRGYVPSGCASRRSSLVKVLELL